MKIYEQLGHIAIGTRIRFLGERIGQDAAEIFNLYGIKMNPKWFPVYYLLSKETNKTITEIASEIGHSHVSVIKILAEMKKANLITERKSSKDRRQTLVRLTAAGKKIESKIAEQYLDVQAALDEIAKNTKSDLWMALTEWEQILSEKSFHERVKATKQSRNISKVTIIPYTDKYHQDFKRLNEEWITQYFKMERLDYESLDHPKKYILDNGGFIFVALYDDKPVGVCALIKRKDRNYPYELAKMAVDTKLRGQNIGWQLGLAVVAKAKSIKAKKLFLESNTILEPAIRLYKKLGFKEVTGLQTPYERCNIQMELILN